MMINRRFRCRAPFGGVQAAGRLPPDGLERRLPEVVLVEGGRVAMWQQVLFRRDPTALDRRRLETGGWSWRARRRS